MLKVHRDLHLFPVLPGHKNFWQRPDTASGKSRGLIWSNWANFSWEPHLAFFPESSQSRRDDRETQACHMVWCVSSGNRWLATGSRAQLRDAHSLGHRTHELSPGGWPWVTWLTEMKRFSTMKYPHTLLVGAEFGLTTTKGSFLVSDKAFEHTFLWNRWAYLRLYREVVKQVPTESCAKAPHFSLVLKTWLKLKDSPWGND